MEADVSEFKKSIPPRINRENFLSYYKLQYDVIILFGLTELKAQIAWKEDVGSTSFRHVHN